MKKEKEKQKDTRNTAEPRTDKEFGDSVFTKSNESNVDCNDLDWGGRGRGGRGERAPNSVNSNIHLTSVSLIMDNGTELLQNSVMDIQRGQRYGLIGRNGVGKSTLLKKLAEKSIPGLPRDLRVLFVQQQVSVSDTNTTVLEALVDSDVELKKLHAERMKLEELLDESCSDERHQQDSETIIEKIAQRLSEIEIDLDVMGSETIEKRALEILKGLQFTDTMIYNSISYLSGGWRMRLSIAQALLQIDSAHLLLMDECTNHLDLHGLNWLIQFLTQGSTPGQSSTNARRRTMILVSHDRSFLDAVCTSMIVMENKQLHYHVGNYSEYKRQHNEKRTREIQILDAADRQRKKADTFIQKQQSNSNSSDPNKQRQAKMIKDKKLERIGNYREDGKRYKLRSLKTLDESSVRLAQKVQIEIEEPIIPMYFPNPTWPPNVGNSTAAAATPIIRMENVSFAYGNNVKGSETNETENSVYFEREQQVTQSFLLNNITLCLTRSSKVALVGRNGVGKSTLCKLISGELLSSFQQSNCDANNTHHKLQGEVWSYPNLRVGHITQYAIEELEQKYGNLTVLEYIEEIGLCSAKAASSIITKASGNVRQYLGAFGLASTRHVTSQLNKLSGGERMRLCFASVLANEPHLLLLDESTNHVDLETLESMSAALNKFDGCVLMVSHNQDFLSGFCNELWIMNKNGTLSILHSGSESFTEAFNNYRRSITTSKNETTSLVNQRREQISMAKKATYKGANATRATGLL